MCSFSINKRKEERINEWMKKRLNSRYMCSHAHINTLYLFNKNPSKIEVTYVKFLSNQLSTGIDTQVIFIVLN